HHTNISHVQYGFHIFVRSKVKYPTFAARGQDQLNNCDRHVYGRADTTVFRTLYNCQEVVEEAHTYCIYIHASRLSLVTLSMPQSSFLIDLHYYLCSFFLNAHNFAGSFKINKKLRRKEIATFALEDGNVSLTSGSAYNG
ncbi:hypothetical protein ACJX0J_025576, partial [Zea mays]